MNATETGLEKEARLLKLHPAAERPHCSFQPDNAQ
jgi:hypothetical protein